MNTFKRFWHKTSHLRVQLVAVLVLLHLVLIFLRAIPVPGYAALARSAWKDVTVKRELDAWNKRIANLGVHMSNEEFEDFLWRLSVKVMDIRQKILGPFEWYYEYFGTSQSWKMFVAPQTHPSRWYVRIYEHNTWKTVYEERSTSHTWYKRQFDHPMMRRAIFYFSWPHYWRNDYAHLAEWVFRKIEIDFPEAERAEVVYFGFDSRSPEEVRANEAIRGEWHSRLSRDFR